MKAVKSSENSALTALDLPQAALSPAMAAYFQKCRDKIGYVPNVLLAYAHDMAKLEAFAAFYNDLMLAPSGLSKLEREMIAVVVSAENRCFYCLTAHGAAVRQLSGRPELGEMLVMNYRAAPLTPRERAMLDFAAMMTIASHRIEEADRQALREVGFTERDIWDIAAVASFFNMSNRMASATDMRPNPEYHCQAR
ncbi:MAG: peroxidase-related enzyme [Beijerinckiaceae bacterium]